MLRHRNVGLLLLLLLGGAAARAAALPDFDSDQQADRWVRAHSPWYRSMAETVDQAGGYTIERGTTMPGGLAYFKDGRGHIELNDVLKGPRRVSVMIFELTNLYHEPQHQEVADRVRRGDLNDPAVFGLLRETIEYDGLRLHREVLLELQAVLDAIPPEMITWISSTAKTFAEYALPYVYDYLKAQAASGHTAFFRKYFDQDRAEYLQSRQPPPGANATN
jgi:hypothetical protein